VVVAPRHEGGARRLVPVELLDLTPDGLRLPCTRSEFEELPAADETEFVAAPGADEDRGGPDVVVRRGDRVEARDGDGGRFHGLVVKKADGRITHVVVGDGLLWSRRTRAIPLERTKP
jgi:hypothetical protein